MTMKFGDGRDAPPAIAEAATIFLQSCGLFAGTMQRCGQPCATRIEIDLDKDVGSVQMKYLVGDRVILDLTAAPSKAGHPIQFVKIGKCL